MTELLDYTVRLLGATVTQKGNRVILSFEDEEKDVMQALVNIAKKLHEIESRLDQKVDAVSSRGGYRAWDDVS